MSGELLGQDEAVSVLLAYAFSGAIGPVEGRGVSYALIDASSSKFSWSVALEDIDGPAASVDRYLIKINRRSKQIEPPELMVLSEAELSEAIFAATGQNLASSIRFTDGALSISYKVAVREDSNAAYIVQLRHHGRVASMDAFMTLIWQTANIAALPLPRVYAIPGELERQGTTARGRQITQFIPGVMASSVYPHLSHEERLVLVRKMALAFNECWMIRLPEKLSIGELIATEADGQVILSVGPDRHHGLGGPFHSVREYLCAYIRSSLVALEKQQGIDEFKEKFLSQIRDFVSSCLYKIPTIVEDIPIVAMHADMGPHNVIVSDQVHTEIRAIIDWEFISSAPYASLYRIIEMLFRKPASNGFGSEYDRADELREAFWDTIPGWKRWNQSEATKAFRRGIEPELLIRTNQDRLYKSGGESSFNLSKYLPARSHLLFKFPKTCFRK